MVDVTTDGGAPVQPWENFLANIDWTGEAGDLPDWQVIESNLGLNLPPDYKAIIEGLPDGVFRADIRLIRPDGSDYLGYFRYRLEDMRHWRASDAERFPYPIYPEEGGLLPVARGAGSAFLFWETRGRPEAWRLIITDDEFTQWSEFDGGLIDFLRELSEAPSNLPRFISQSSREAAARTTGSPSIWDRFPLHYGPPLNVLDELTERIDAARSEECDWTGLQFPDDYKTFIDRYGPGRLADIEIVSPFGPDGWSMNALNQRSVPEDSELVLGGHIGGLILWGTTPDGWACGWAVASKDPNTWGVVLVDSSFAHFEYPDVHSFSSFLLKYISAERVDFFLGREFCNRSREWQPARKP